MTQEWKQKTAEEVLADIARAPSVIRSIDRRQRQADFDKYKAGEAQGRYPKPNDAPEAKGERK
jgi:hypothetical protein